LVSDNAPHAIRALVASRWLGVHGRRSKGGTMSETRKLGQGEVRVGAIALGARAFAGWYDTRDDEAGVLAIQRTLDAGITLIDTAEVYGNGKSEGLVGRAVRERRDQADR
jgi:aryl-alcohol dehydrogenase-like predicted oxidoreductase